MGWNEDAKHRDIDHRNNGCSAPSQIADVSLVFRYDGDSVYDDLQ